MRLWQKSGAGGQPLTALSDRAVLAARARGCSNLCAAPSGPPAGVRPASGPAGVVASGTTPNGR